MKGGLGKKRVPYGSFYYIEVTKLISVTPVTGSVGCRIYSRSHQILGVNLLLSSLSHHYWLKNGGGSDLVRAVYPHTWTLGSQGRADTREMDGLLLYHRDRLMRAPCLLALLTNLTAFRRMGQSLAFSNFFSSIIPKQLLGVHNNPMRWVSQILYLLADEGREPQGGCDLYQVIQQALLLALPSAFSKLQLSHWRVE